MLILICDNNNVTTRICSHQFYLLRLVPFTTINYSLGSLEEKNPFRHPYHQFSSQSCYSVKAVDS